LSPEDPVTLGGIGASSGVAVGRAFLLDRRRLHAPEHHIDRAAVEAELKRLEAAIDTADRQLQEVKHRLSSLPDPGEHHLILEAHRLMLRDPSFLGEVQRRIGEDHVNAEWAVRATARKIKEAFERIDDEYFRERRQDVEFVADRVIRNLMGQLADVEEHQLPPDAIVVAHDLSPADAAILLQPGRVLGLVTDLGGKTSHTAIVSRARGIPAVVGTGTATDRIGPGDEIGIDGDRGLVILHPGGTELADLESARARRERAELRLAVERHLPARTADGVEVRLHANVEFEEELPYLDHVGAGGIGLFRTEFLYLSREGLPTEEEHYSAYRRVLERMGDRPVTIRTLDLGGDKIPSERGRPDEQNPALGLRAIRFCIQHPDLFRIQLRALLRASVHGNLRILFPMISGAGELAAAKRALAQAREELEREGLPVASRVPIGIMVELPSAVAMADRLARDVDFFSIGTNDLIQYSLGIDRQNRDVGYLYRPMHLAVLRMLRATVEAGHDAGISVAMCGEMAGDPFNTLVLLGLGVDELSMAAVALPTVRRVVRAARTDDGRQLLARALELSSAEEIEALVHGEMDRRFGDILAGRDGPPPGP
jgi:phosphotransferase system enzyme I (PtsI)